MSAKKTVKKPVKKLPSQKTPSKTSNKEEIPPPSNEEFEEMLKEGSIPRHIIQQDPEKIKSWFEKEVKKDQSVPEGRMTDAPHAHMFLDATALSSKKENILVAINSSGFLVKSTKTVGTIWSLEIQLPRQGEKLVQPKRVAGTKSNNTRSKNKPKNK